MEHHICYVYYKLECIEYNIMTQWEINDIIILILGQTNPTEFAVCNYEYIPLFDLLKAILWQTQKIVAETAHSSPQRLGPFVFVQTLMSTSRERMRKDWINVCYASPEQAVPDRP